MSLLRKRPQPPPPAPTIAESIQSVIESSAKPSLFAHADFVKQVDCSQCGATKQLPSQTAYLYCDHCGALIDYDFRLANSGTNAGLTNTVYHRLVAQVQGEMNHALARADRDRYRELLKPVFAEWIRQCPQAVSPRAKSDPEFRDRMVAYLAECSVSRDFEPGLTQLDAQLNYQIGGLERIPNGSGPWQVSSGIWAVATLYKEIMEKTYAMLDATGVSALDPDEAPPGVALRMEYSTFCQGWIPHLNAADGERLLAFYGLTAAYARVKTADLAARNCGGCGAELATLPSASAVVCESCGRKLDVGGGQIPCRNCGAPLSFPVGASRIDCPYCQSGTHRL
jgi:LSD1 subclass zinc finger protein